MDAQRWVPINMKRKQPEQHARMAALLEKAGGMMMKRVAVTGLGVISPVGNDVPTFWNALCSGTCGIGPITKFDATDYPVKLAAEVRDFDPRQYMEKLDILHSDVYTHFAMAAACQAVADSGIAGTLDAERVGVYIGSGIGGIATFMTEHSKL